MIKLCFKVLTRNNARNFVKSFHNSSVSCEKWDLITAVCLERRPVITPPLNDLEHKFQALLSQIEYEQSLKSDHEVRHEQEVKQQELLKKGETDVDVALKATAQDLLDGWAEELAQFKPGSRTTDDDKTYNLKSLNRKLDKHLVLLVKQHVGDETHFLLPQGLREDGETLRQTAERVLKGTCGPEMKVQFYGNAPSGFYKYKYPQEVRKTNDSVGAKVFIYFVTHRKGQMPAKGTDFQWLDRTELSTTLHSKYYNSLAQFLIDEE